MRKMPFFDVMVGIVIDAYNAFTANLADKHLPSASGYRLILPEFLRVILLLELSPNEYIGAYSNLPIVVELTNDSYSMGLGTNYFDSGFYYLS